MKKFIFAVTVSLFLFPLCVKPVTSQSPAAQKTKAAAPLKKTKKTAVKATSKKASAKKGDAMLIFIKDGEEALVNFPAHALKSTAKITVIFPKGYKDNLQKYPALYIVSGVNMDKKQLANILPEDKQNMAVVTIRLQANAKMSGLAKFLSEEVLPYFETNYRFDDLPANRAVAAGGDSAVNLLSNINVLSNYFKNFALLFDTTTAMPQTAALQKDIFVWASGNISNLTRLQKMFEDGGLSCPQNFAYVFDTPLAPPQTKESAAKSKNADVDYSSFWAWINFDLLFNKTARAVKEANAYAQTQSVSLSSPAAFNYWLNLTLQNDYVINYVPQQLKIAPPFLNWDFTNAALSVIAGAEKGKVKITPLTPLGAGVAGYIKIEK